MVKTNQLINVVIVIAIVYVVFKTGILNSLFSGLKGIGNQIGSGTGAGGGSGGSTAITPQTQTSTTKTTSNGKIDIDVSGENACACANGVCKGNCSNGASIDPNDFDPFLFVQENT